MKNSAFLCCELILVLAAFSSADAQVASPQPPTAIKETPTEAKIADISVEANVTASEIKFTQTGNYKIEFRGFPERKTLWEENRQNWPKNPQSGVTYSNIGFQIRVTSRFAEIEKIVNSVINGNASITSLPVSLPTNSQDLSEFSTPIAPLAPKPVLAPKAVKPIEPQK